MAVRVHKSLSGLTIGKVDHHISLYADDIIFFLTYLKNSIPSLMRLSETFGGISVYIINNSKSVLMFLNKEGRHSPIIDTPFMKTTEGFRYLGVEITSELSEIIPTNYDPLVDDVTEVLNRWSNLPISMMV